MLSILADTRESAILDSAGLRKMLADGKSDIQLIVKQISIGDYIISCDGLIIAVIERKSLRDFAASIKDGRMSNKQKMIDFRSKTGCSLFYLIEGKPPADPTTKVSGIAYSSIESSIFHIAIRDNINAVYSKSASDTAHMLIRLARSIGTLCKKGYEPNVEPLEIDAAILPSADGAILPSADGANDGNTDGANDNSAIAPQDDELSSYDIRALIQQSRLDDNMTTLTTVVAKPDSEILANIWSQFSGLGRATSSQYLIWSIADVVCNRIQRTDLELYKFDGRRKIPAKVLESMYNPTKSVQANILANVPRMSIAKASGALAKFTLRELIEMPVAQLAAIPTASGTGAAVKKIGKVTAANILRFLNMSIRG